MRQLTFITPGKLEWLDVPQPRIGAPREAIVEPLAVANCDLDPLIVHGGTHLFRPPFAVGHEFVARVVEVGAEVRSFRPGDVVCVAFNVACGTCIRCQRGLTASCASVTPGAMFGTGEVGGSWGGALSDLIKVPFADAMMLALPPDVPFATVASLGDNIADAWRTVAPLSDAKLDKSVLIIGGGGAGSVGLYAVDIAKALGAEQIDYVDTDRERLEVAETLGAKAIEGPPPRKLGSYAITVDASLDAGGLACALRSTAPEGICTCAGVFTKAEQPIPLFDLYVKGITFRTGRAHARPCMEEILGLVRGGALHPEVVTHETVPWDQAAEAWAVQKYKTVIIRN